MKYSTRLSDAVHILVLISENKDGTLSSSDIATSVYTNPSYVRQLMSRLRNSGIISSVRGLATPTLIKEASHITLLDIYKAVEGDKPLLHLDTHTNPECGVGMDIQFALADYYDRIQQDAEHSMQGISLQVKYRRILPCISKAFMNFCFCSQNGKRSILRKTPNSHLIENWMFK